MLIEIKRKTIRFLQKITNADPSYTIKSFEDEALELEMELRQSYQKPVPAYPLELDNIMKELPALQKEYYESIRWLLNPKGARGSGRSHLMALAFIEHSLYYGIWIKIFDHTTHPLLVKEMLKTMSKIVGPINTLRLSIKGMQRNNIEIKVERVPDESEIYQFNNPFKIE